MENLPSASNDSFHSFMSYEDLPGILVPQKVYLRSALRQEPKDVRTFATFYRHQTLGATITAELGATLGVSLAEALAFDSKMLRPSKSDSKNGGCNTSLAPLNRLYLRFVLKWPGCTEYVPTCTRHGGDGSVWTAPRLAFEVARAVHEFYELNEKYIDRRSPANDWTPDRIPFDKLYLLELRQVTERMFQPVLYYDAD